MRFARPIGSLPVRKLLAAATALVVATLAYAFVASPVAMAADASWNGAAINFEGKQYVYTGNAKPGDSHKLAPGTKIYAFIETPAPDGSGQQKARLIYFAPSTDPATATSALYSVYDFTPPSNFSNPSPPRTVSLTPQSAAGGAKGSTSCDSTFTFGIGWIVCPVTNFLASAMDWLFGILSGFLTVRPVQTGQDNPLYRAWSVMRNFANIAFVIGFLVIIYSQITSAGLSSYGAKRLLPRLIIAAVLVNVSYWVCAVAIDLSNIIGYAVQDLFVGLRNSFVGSEGNSWQVVSWKSLGGFILSGGTAAAAAGIGGFALVAGTVGGALYLMLPALVGAILSVLVALLVMAARQAIITIMVIVAPLALVAYLLPNTEKYFEKWKDLFLTMLIMFPAFSVVFGGAQLAGTAIIQNADSINTIILGMLVQVAPVAITPLLLKFSGSLLGKIAGMVNNPNRGAIDRTRKWSQERANQHKARVMANAGPRRRNVLGRAARNIDQRRRLREGWHKRNEAVNENNLMATDAYQRLDMSNREAERTKKTIENAHEAHWNEQIRLNTQSLEQELKLRVTVDRASAAKARLDTIHEEFKTGNYPAFGPPTASMSRLMNQSSDIERDLALTALRKQTAERQSKTQLTDALLKNTDTIDGQTLREYAGGVQGIEGANTVLASAVAAYRKEYNDKVNEKIQLLRHFNLDGSQRQALALGNNVTAVKNGVSYTFRQDDDYSREAAIETQLKEGSYADMKAIIEETGDIVVDPVTLVSRPGKTHAYRTTISQAIPGNNLNRKAAFWGARTIDDVAQGKIRGEAALDEAAAYFLVQGKISDDALAGMAADALRQLFEVGDQSRPTTTQTLSPADQLAFTENAQAIRESARRILNNDMLRRTADEAAQKILDQYGI